MIKSKYREFLVSNYILQNTNLLFKKSISDIKIIEAGKIVELLLYYLPTSKEDVWALKKEFFKEPQYVNSYIKNGKLCAKFIAPSKYADLIICKLHTLNISEKELRTLENSETKKPGRS